MTRCIIHIGMHKTGSTSIQRSLHGFENDRFVYAKIGNDSNHSLPVYSMFAPNPGRHHLHLVHGRDVDAVRAYIDEVSTDLEQSIAAARGRTLLISGEDIGVLPQRDLIRLHDYFRSRVDDLTVVAYVRPPAAFMASHFQQRVKVASIDCFDPQAMYRNYQVFLGKFDEIFGRERVRLWKFDPQSFPGGCVVQDFCARLEIPLPKRRIVRLNESLSRQAVAALYTYAKFARKRGAKMFGGAEGTKLGLLIGGSGKFRFSPDVVRPVLDANRSDIEWMEARLGESLREDLGDHRADDVRDETDLLRVDPELASKLLATLGQAAPDGVNGETPEEIAWLVGALRGEHVPPRGEWPGLPEGDEMMRARAGQEETQIPLPEFVAQLRQAHPTLLNGMSQQEAQSVVRCAFAYLNEKLAQTEEGVLSFPGLGRFRVVKAEKEVNGKKTMQKRIVFRPTDTAGGNL